MIRVGLSENNLLESIIQNCMEQRVLLLELFKENLLF